MTDQDEIVSIAWEKFGERLRADPDAPYPGKAFAEHVTDTDRHECSLGDDCGNGGPACVELEMIAQRRVAADRHRSTLLRYLREKASPLTSDEQE